METQFVPYELAVKLKELGYDDYCLADYYDVMHSGVTLIQKHESLDGYFGHPKYLVDAPLWQQAFRFISSKMKFEINNHSSYALTFDTEFSIQIREFIDYDGYSINDVATGNYETIEKLIELCK